MTPKQVIAHFKTEREAAAALGVTRQAVNYWKRHRAIPQSTQALIQIMTDGKLKARFK